jgi:hypothetical protein
MKAKNEEGVKAIARTLSPTLFCDAADGLMRLMGSGMEGFRICLLVHAAMIYARETRASNKSLSISYLP